MGVPAIREGCLRVRGLVVHHYDWGSPSSPPVLVLHGMMGNAREWDTVVQALGTGSAWWRWVNERHGRYDWAPSYDARRARRRSSGRDRDARPGPVSLVGRSTGVMAALIAASERPDLVARLAVLDIGPDSVRTEPASELQAFLAGLAAASYRDVDEAVAAWMADDPFSRPELVRRWAYTTTSSAAPTVVCAGDSTPRG